MDDFVDLKWISSFFSVAIFSNRQDEVMGEDGLEDSQDAQVPWMEKSWFFMVPSGNLT